MCGWRGQALASLLLGMTLVGASGARAQEAECKGDVKKLCKDATGANVLTCMDQHKGEASAACKAKFEHVKDKWADFMSNCQADLAKYCGDKKVADGSLGKCVKDKEKDVGTACKTSYASMKGLVPKGLKMPAGLKMP